MTANVNDILDAALKRPGLERLLVATRLMDTLPSDAAGLSEYAPGFLDELEHRASDSEPTVSVAELCKQD